MNAVIIRAKVIEEELHTQLLKGNASSIEESHQEMAQCKREAEDIQDYENLIYDALQEAKMKEGLIGFLGSEKRANFLEMTILTLIIFVLGLMTWDILYLNGKEHAEMRLNVFYIDVGCCIIFLSEFFLRYQYAEDKRWYWRAHWIDFVTSIPIPAVSEIRYGRAFRFLRVMRFEISLFVFGITMGLSKSTIQHFHFIYSLIFC